MSSSQYVQSRSNHNCQDEVEVLKSIMNYVHHTLLIPFIGYEPEDEILFPILGTVHTYINKKVFFLDFSCALCPSLAFFSKVRVEHFPKFSKFEITRYVSFSLDFLFLANLLLHVGDFFLKRVLLTSFVTLTLTISCTSTLYLMHVDLSLLILVYDLNFVAPSSTYNLHQSQGI
ncbi:hypothetical protein DFH28DRAFT_964879 [Melampsora americana]|nr:hypothetical protein DFH28DRAFT_964879 [Melampsora americana]